MHRLDDKRSLRIRARGQIRGRARGQIRGRVLGQVLGRILGQGQVRGSVRDRLPSLAAALLALAAMAASSSCVFDTKTNFCAEFGLHCREGQECAANEAVCIDIGGCGNGVLDTGEVCDDGNTRDGEPDEDGVIVLDACNSDCTSTQVCGNEITDADEQCDDGTRNGDPDSTCDSACRFVSRVCGNSIVDAAGEECDPGPEDSASCNSDMAGPASCKVSKCGDGHTNTADDEECDSFDIDTAECIGKQCKLSICGDNYINEAAGETCEAGGNNMGKDTATCNGNGAGLASCHVPMCGDGHPNAMFKPLGSTEFEACDSLGGGDTATCNGNNGGNNGPGSCQTPKCGDGYTNMVTGETCDDGGSTTAMCLGTEMTVPTSLRCKRSRCGDNYRNMVAGEDCDSSSGADTTTCNGMNAGPDSCRTSTCGDGYHNAVAGEDCDGGMDDTATCNGGSESTPPTLGCKIPRCGDNYTNMAAGEQCDSTSGNETPSCNGKDAGDARCRTAYCGDNYTNTLAGETCDPGSTDSAMCNGPNAGSVMCQAATCGDGYINAAKGEQCETNSPCTDPMMTCMGCTCVMPMPIGGDGQARRLP